MQHYKRNVTIQVQSSLVLSTCICRKRFINQKQNIMHSKYYAGLLNYRQVCFSFSTHTVRILETHEEKAIQRNISKLYYFLNIYPFKNIRDTFLHCLSFLSFRTYSKVVVYNNQVINVIYKT